MKDQGFIIYPGKLTKIDSFRIGCIGQIDNKIMKRYRQIEKVFWSARLIVQTRI